jgi:hypothetical protein
MHDVSAEYKTIGTRVDIPWRYQDLLQRACVVSSLPVWDFPHGLCLISRWFHWSLW